MLQLRNIVKSVVCLVKRGVPSHEMDLTVGSIKKLNNYNCSIWSTCFDSYLQGRYLWEVVGGSESMPPPKVDANALKKWKVRAGKVMFAIKVSIEEEMLEHIRYAPTPKEAWNISQFLKKNKMRLQNLKTELMIIKQGNMSINQYFTKVKSLCREILELDSASKIGEARMRRIIFYGIKPEYQRFITAVQEWPKPPSLEKLENLLANQETLAKQIAGVSIKSDMNEEALYSNHRRSRSRCQNNAKFIKEENNNNRSPIRWKGQNSHSGGAQQCQEDDDRQERKLHRCEIECFNRGKKGHYTQECRYKRVEGNAAMSVKPQVESEEEWDFNIRVACAIDEPIKMNEFMDTSKDDGHELATSAVFEYLERSCESEEDWDLTDSRLYEESPLEEENDFKQGRFQEQSNAMDYKEEKLCNKEEEQIIEEFLSSLEDGEFEEGI